MINDCSVCLECWPGVLALRGASKVARYAPNQCLASAVGEAALTVVGATCNAVDVEVGKQGTVASFIDIKGDFYIANHGTMLCPLRWPQKKAKTRAASA